jgi:hypothetical protein
MRTFEMPFVLGFGIVIFSFICGMVVGLFIQDSIKDSLDRLEDKE